MSLIGDIVSAYRRPQRVLLEQVAGGITDAQTLFYAMLFGFMNFLASLPALSIQASADRPLFALAAANLVVTLFVVPLCLFAFAGICGVVISWLGGHIEWITCRRVAVWSALVAAPLVLLAGLAAPILPELLVTLIHIVTAFVFLRQLISGLNLLGFQSIGRV